MLYFCPMQISSVYNITNMGCEAQLVCKCLFTPTIIGRRFGREKSVRVTYFFVWDQGSLEGHRMQDYKSLCTAVTICATLFFAKFDSSILIPLTSESTSSSRDLLHPCQVHPRSKFGDRSSASCRDNADIIILTMT